MASARPELRVSSGTSWQSIAMSIFTIYTRTLHREYVVPACKSTHAVFDGGEDGCMCASHMIPTPCHAHESDSSWCAPAMFRRHPYTVPSHVHMTGRG